MSFFLKNKHNNFKTRLLVWYGPQINLVVHEVPETQWDHS